MNKDAPDDRSDDRIDSEHARIVAEVLEDQARRKAVREALDTLPGDDSDRSFFVQVGLLVTGTFFFYLLFFSPTWIAPTAPDPITAEQTEDGLRFAIAFTASRIESFRTEQGRLPQSIDEVGGARDGVEYQRLDQDTFVVRATTGATTLHYVSTVPLADFVGDAMDRVLPAGTS
jgi:hypothetical protein